MLLVFILIQSSQPDYIILHHGTMLHNIQMLLLIKKTKESVMLTKMIQTNYVLKQLLLKMILLILEQLIDGLQRRQNINAYIINNHLNNHKLPLFQILLILYIKEKQQYTIKKFNITECMININLKIITRIRTILHYLMFNMTFTVNWMKMEHVHHLNGDNSVEITSMLTQIFMKLNTINSHSVLLIKISKYKW